MSGKIAQEIIIDGMTVQTLCCPLPAAPLVLARSGGGFVMCGYLDIQVADALNAAACVVTGVDSVEKLLARPVVKVSRAAAAFGVQPGMSGKDALVRMNAGV